MSLVAHRDCNPSSCGVLLPFLPEGDAEYGIPGNSGGLAAQQTYDVESPAVFLPSVYVHFYSFFSSPGVGRTTWSDPEGVYWWGITASLD